jgi:glycosyltransferase involved in cell wall biosynthesis
MNQLVSIVIPTFNRANLIQETLESIANQTYSNWECLVIDDGSTDNTDDVLNNIIKTDSRFKYIKRHNNKIKGVSSCRNIGFENACGEFINFIDSDDLITSNHIEFHLKNFSKIDIDCSVSNAKIFIDNKENIKSFWSKNIDADDIVLEMIKNDVMWAMGSVFWRKSIFKNSKPFQEDLICSEDWAMHLIQVINNLKYIISQETTFLVRNHENRVGKSIGFEKISSIFRSRICILDLLNSKKNLTNQREMYLLKDVFFALRLSIQFSFSSLMILILKYLVKNFLNFNNKLIILKILLFAFPVYFLTKKGERLFKI